MLLGGPAGKAALEFRTGRVVPPLLALGAALAPLFPLLGPGLPARLALLALRAGLEIAPAVASWIYAGLALAPGLLAPGPVSPGTLAVLAGSALAILASASLASLVAALGLAFPAGPVPLGPGLGRKDGFGPGALAGLGPFLAPTALGQALGLIAALAPAAGAAFLGGATLALPVLGLLAPGSLGAKALELGLARVPGTAWPWGRQVF